VLNEKLKLNQNVFGKNVEKKSMREALGDTLVKLGKENESIIVLDADLMESTKTDRFENAFPERFIQCGIAEQNMASIAAGLALEGKIPVMTSFSIFSPGRNWEQIRLSICYSKANVKIISTHAGLSHCYDGGMAQALEDIALTRVLPAMTVVCPIDTIEAEKAIGAAVELEGPVYIRLGREATDVITTNETPFEIGKANVLVEGTDLTIVATGDVTHEALRAAHDLKAKHNVSAEVISCPTIKPLDVKTLAASARKTGKVVTVENHQILGGLGGAVAETLSEKEPVKVLRIGVDDTFGESGTYQELKDKYGLSAHRIVASIVKFFGESV
jgi:transketolase